MDSLLPIGLVMIGFFVGTLIFAKVGRWIVTLYALFKDRAQAGEAEKVGRFVSAALLSSGPWLLIAAVIFAYNVASEAWAVWVFAGFCAALALFSVVSIYFALKARRENAV